MYQTTHRSRSKHGLNAKAGRSMVLLSALLLSTLLVTGQPQAASDPEMLIATPDKYYTSPVWSPQGNTIAFSASNYNGIWLADADGSNIRLLTADEGAGFRFSWSPDGNHILARTTGTENRRRFARIQVYDINTKGYDILQDKSRNIQGLPLWTPEGSHAVYVFNGQPVLQPVPGKKQETLPANTLVPYSTGDKLFAWNLSTRSSHMVAEFSERFIFNLSPSPSGNRIAFQVQGKGLFVADMDGSNPMHLGFGEMAAWMPDEQFAVVSVVEDDGHTITGAELFAVDMKTGQSYPLTEHTSVIALNPNVSPCGKWVIFNDEKGVIYKMALQ